MKNPFTLSLGRIPKCRISQDVYLAELYSEFLSEDPCIRVCILSGAQGSGKTIALRHILNRFENEKDWVVIQLNRDKNMFADLKERLQQAGLLEEDLKTTPKRILIAVDNISHPSIPQEFLLGLEQWYSQGYPIFLVMAGRTDNCAELLKCKSMAFLQNTLRVYLETLYLPDLAQAYQNQLEVDVLESQKMAAFTKGYPYAFQVLGFLCSENHYPLHEAKRDFDRFMNERVYRKIWQDLSQLDQQILTCIAVSESEKITDIRKAADMNSNDFNAAKQHLINLGLLMTPYKGAVRFALPRFKEFVLDTHFWSTLA